MQQPKYINLEPSHGGYTRILDRLNTIDKPTTDVQKTIDQLQRWLQIHTCINNTCSYCNKEWEA